MSGWLDQQDIRLTLNLVEVEVEAELGKLFIFIILNTLSTVSLAQLDDLSNTIKRQKLCQF